MTRHERDQLASILKQLRLTRDVAAEAVEAISEMLAAVDRELEIEDQVNDDLERIARGGKS